MACPHSRTGRRIYWALLSAILSWWLIWTLKSVDVQGTESLWLVVSAVRLLDSASATLVRGCLGAGVCCLACCL